MELLKYVEILFFKDFISNFYLEINILNKIIKFSIYLLLIEVFFIKIYFNKFLI